MQQVSGEVFCTSASKEERECCDARDRANPGHVTTTQASKEIFHLVWRIKMHRSGHQQTGTM